MKMLAMLRKLALMIPPLRNLHEERNYYAKSLAAARDEILILREALARLERSEAASTSLVTAIRDLEGADFPVYMNTGFPSFMSKEVKGLPRVVVVTIPKSGTYLVSAYLKEIGLIDSGIHLDDTGFTDYRNRNISEMVSNYREFRKTFPLDKSIKLLKPGTFAVGHIGFNNQTITDLANTNIIFVIREIRTVIVSMMRWLSRPGRGEDAYWKTIENNQQRTLSFLQDTGQSLIGWFNAISGWSTCHDVLVLQFEVLNGGVGQADLAYQCAKKAGVALSVGQAKMMLDSILGKPTLTWSGKHSDLDEYWSNEAEELFQSLGGRELNRRLGYAE